MKEDMHSSAQQIFQRLNKEIWLLTAASENKPGGLIATGVLHASISEETPRLLVAIGQQHYTHQLIDASQKFAIHLLKEDQSDLVWQFGVTSTRDGDKFGDLEYCISENGNPLLSNCLGWMECEIETAWDGGGRTFYLAAITNAELPNGSSFPLLISTVIQNATEDQLSLLQEQLILDAEWEKRAIQKWRTESKQNS